MSSIRIALLSFLAGAVVIGGIFLLWRVFNPVFAPEPMPRVTEEIATTTEPIEEEWTTYTNHIFGFSIEHPASWQVAESNKDGTPMISIYKPGSSVEHPGAPDPVPPFTHWNNATHVSVYPSGIPTEGVSSLWRPSRVTLSVDTKHANDMLAFPHGSTVADLQIIDNGVPWAIFIDFENLPTNWKPWGFLWAGLAVPDLSTLCLRNGEEVDADHCDPLAGDEIIHIGTPNAADRALEERMLASFRFLE